MFLLNFSFLALKDNLQDLLGGDWTFGEGGDPLLYETLLLKSCHLWLLTYSFVYTNCSVVKGGGALTMVYTHHTLGIEGGP